ncbi:MAG: hypothetical protein ABSF67_02520 [Roseiarcus sp.]|jgi:hypothetical protein
MAEDPIPSAEPEISAPPPTAPPSPARSDPQVIDGEATEIRDETAAAAEAPPADTLTPPEPNRPAAYAIPAAAGLGGAILGAALALVAAWLIDPRASALDDARARLAAVEKSVESDSASASALDKRIAALEAGAASAAKGGALDALGRRIGALEASGGDAKTALDEARAARADAARALAAAQSAPPSTNAAAPAEPSALEPRLAKLESDLAAAETRLNQLGGLDERLAKLEAAAGTAPKFDGANAAPKSDARVAMAKGGSESAASVAVLALSLEQRFAAGAPFAAELAALSQLGVGADALAPLKPFAESGAPSPSALAASWAKIEPAVAAAAPPPERSGWDRLLDHMRALVRVRRVGEAAGSDESDSPVARIGAALERGDLAAALAAFGQLPAASRAAGAVWADAANARAAAAKAASTLRADAIGRLAAAKD